MLKSRSQFPISSDESNSVTGLVTGIIPLGCEAGHAIQQRSIRCVALYRIEVINKDFHYLRPCALFEIDNRCFLAWSERAPEATSLGLFSYPTGQAFDFAVHEEAAGRRRSALERSFRFSKRRSVLHWEFIALHFPQADQGQRDRRVDDLGLVRGYFKHSNAVTPPAVYSPLIVRRQRIGRKCYVELDRYRLRNSVQDGRFQDRRIRAFTDFDAEDMVV